MLIYQGTILSRGEVSERFKEPVLKTGDSSRAMGSNPILSAKHLRCKVAALGDVPKW